ALLGVWRDHNAGDAGAVAPDAVGVRRADVVPAAAVLIVGDDDGSVGPVGTVLHGVDNVGDMLLASQQVGVAGVLVVRAERFDEGDGRQAAVGEIGEEVVLVGQVLAAVGIHRGRAVVDHELAGGGVKEEWREVVVVSERLMVPLEERINGGVGRRLPIVGRVARRAGQGIVPAAGVPLPADTGV